MLKSRPTMVAIALTLLAAGVLYPSNGKDRLTVTQRRPAALICQDPYGTICKNKAHRSDPTGVVLSDEVEEAITRKIYQEIKKSHPEWSDEQVTEGFIKRIYTQKKRKKMNKVFKWVRSAIETYIENHPDKLITVTEKRELTTRVRKVKLELPPPASVYSDAMDLFTKNDVYYERLINGDMRLRVGGAYLATGKSWFNMVFTFAHELGHSIDPCEIRSARHSFPAYDRLTACFLKDGLIATRETRSECGHNDQLSETFADWIAVKITAQALEKFGASFSQKELEKSAANSVRDLCEEDEEELLKTDTEHHPSPRLRINKIFADNPKIMEILGCQVTGNENYCDFEIR